MFTGIVEETGLVRSRKERDAVVRLEVEARVVLAESDLGASIAVNGVCLTVVERAPDGVAFDVGPETLARTTLGRLRPGDRINLERSLRLGSGLGGHLVLGHVDGIAIVEDVTRIGETARLGIRLPGPELEPLLIPQGSVAVDGVSLTVAALGERWFEIMVIPHTLAVTTLGEFRPGRAVNVEVDVIGKYVLRSLALRGSA